MSAGLMNVSPESARRTMALLWLGFFLVNLAMVFYLYFGDWIEQDNFKASFSQLNSSFVPYVGVILAYYLTERRMITSRSGRAGMPFAIALLSSLVWNAMVFLFIARVVLLRGTMEDAVRAIADFGAMLSWLVAPAIGFYFAKPSVSGK